MKDIKFVSDGFNLVFEKVEKNVLEDRSEEKLLEEEIAFCFRAVG